MTGKEHTNPFHTPLTVPSKKPRKSAAKLGKQKVFKQIEIADSGNENSDDEEDYAPPKNAKEDTDESDDERSSGSDAEPEEKNILADRMKDIPAECKLSRKRKAKNRKEFM